MSGETPLVVAALSGGVDSATAAALLVEQGHRVVGMTMRLYDARGTAASSGGRCCGPRDTEDARAVCAHLGIPGNGASSPGKGGVRATFITMFTIAK